MHYIVTVFFALLGQHILQLYSIDNYMNIKFCDHARFA